MQVSKIFPFKNPAYGEKIYHAAAISIQSFWRGHQIRKNLSEIELEFENIVQEVESSCLSDIESKVEWKRLPIENCGLRLPVIIHEQREPPPKIHSAHESQFENIHHDEECVEEHEQSEYSGKEHKCEGQTSGQLRKENLSQGQSKTPMQKLKYILQSTKCESDTQDNKAESQPLQLKNDAVEKKSKTPIDEEANNPVETNVVNENKTEKKLDCACRCESETENASQECTIVEELIAEGKIASIIAQEEGRQECVCTFLGHTQPLVPSPEIVSSPIESPSTPKSYNKSVHTQSPLVMYNSESFESHTMDAIRSKKPPIVASPHSFRHQDTVRMSSEILISEDDLFCIPPTKSHTPVQFKKILQKSNTRLGDDDESDNSDGSDIFYESDEDDIRMSTVALGGPQKPTTLNDYLKMSQLSQSTNDEKLAQQIELLITEAALKKRKKILRAKSKLQAETK